MKRMVLPLTLFWSLPSTPICQEYPFLRDVHISAVVSYKPSMNLFTYSFALTNNLRSIGRIQDFELDISRPSTALLLDTSGLQFVSRLEENYFRRRYNESYVPIGFSGLPGNEWTAMLTNRLTVSVFADTLFIGPGGTVRGIVLTSKGLPGIRPCVVEPDFEDDVLFPSIEDTSANAMTTTQMDSIREAVNYHGWTIGPTAPPMVFEASVWIDTLLSYTRQSVDLGWLGSGRDDDCDNDEHPQDGIEKNIERRLVMAQRDLQRGDSVKARRDLEHLVNKVDRLWKRGQMVEKRHEHDRGDWWQHRKEWVVMTSEAYALLKYNTDYLIDRLPEKESHGKKPRKEDKD
jgi:hypothetical protein